MKSNFSNLLFFILTLYLIELIYQQPLLLATLLQKLTNNIKSKILQNFNDIIKEDDDFI